MSFFILFKNNFFKKLKHTSTQYICHHMFQRKLLSNCKQDLLLIRKWCRKIQARNFYEGLKDKYVLVVHHDHIRLLAGQVHLASGHKPDFNQHCYQQQQQQFHLLRQYMFCKHSFQTVLLATHKQTTFYLTEGPGREEKCGLRGILTVGKSYHMQDW